MLATRFAQCSPWAARLILAAAAVMALALALAGNPAPSAPGTAKAPPFSDVRLYRTIMRRVQAGEDYYVAAAAEQRAHNYPMWPPQVVRPPTEAVMLAALRTDTLRWAALQVLAAVTAVALLAALARTSLTSRERLWTLAFGLLGFIAVVCGSGPYLHEVWAGVLLMLSLALHRRGGWPASIVAGLLACMFRETALPYLFIVGALAMWSRRWREAAGWAGAIGVFAVLYGLHLDHVIAQHRPGDLTSQGWIRFGGLPFIIAIIRCSALFILIPPWATGISLVAVGLGFLGCRDGWIGRCGLVLFVFLGLFAVVGRPDNDYWGFLIAPLPPLGLALAPAALRDLAVRAAGATPRTNPLWRALTSGVS